MTSVIAFVPVKTKTTTGEVYKIEPVPDLLSASKEIRDQWGKDYLIKHAIEIKDLTFLSNLGNPFMWDLTNLNIKKDLIS